MLINVGDITEHGFSTSTLLKRYKTTHVCLNFRKFYQCFFFGALQKHCLCSIIWRESGNGNLSILIVPKLGKLPIKYFDSG